MCVCVHFLFFSVCFLKSGMYVYKVFLCSEFKKKEVKQKADRLPNNNNNNNNHLVCVCVRVTTYVDIV